MGHNLDSTSVHSEDVCMGISQDANRLLIDEVACLHAMFVFEPNSALGISNIHSSTSITEIIHVN